MVSSSRPEQKKDCLSGDSTLYGGERPQYSRVNTYISFLWGVIERDGEPTPIRRPSPESFYTPVQHQWDRLRGTRHHGTVVPWLWHDTSVSPTGSYSAKRNYSSSVWPLFNRKIGPGLGSSGWQRESFVLGRSLTQGSLGGISVSHVNGRIV